MDKRERVAVAIFNSLVDSHAGWDQCGHAHEDYLKSAGAAIAALEPMDKPRVKPLEWLSLGEGYKSFSLLGEYQVYPTASRRNHKHSAYFIDALRKSHILGYFEPSESAKAAAQADYEARILAAIEPALSVREAARVLLGHTPKITAKPLAEMSEAMKIDAHPAILLRGFCAALRSIEDGKDDD